MKQTKTLRRISVAIVAVLLITMSVLSVTLAKYTTEFSGSDTISVAKWAVAVSNKNQENASESFALSLVSDTDGTNAVADKLAPGFGGKFEVKITNSSDVKVDYVLTFKAAENKPTNLKFYTDSNYTTEITADSISGVYSSDDLAGNLAIGSDSAKETVVTVYWQWAYETADGDATDTSEGIDAAAMKVEVTVVVTQSNPNSSTGS